MENLWLNLGVFYGKFCGSKNQNTEKKIIKKIFCFHKKKSHKKKTS